MVSDLVDPAHLWVPEQIVVPAHHWVPDYHQTFGPEVADLCASVGYAPDPEQRLVLDTIFAVDRQGKSVARDVGICGPRQNIKSSSLKMATLGWMYVLDLALVIWSAHEFATAQEAFRDFLELIENNPILDSEVLRTSRGKTGIRRGNGEESIELRGNRRLKFKARTKDGGRGLTGDRIVLDEAMKIRPEMLAALIPTLRAVPDPQVIFAGSAGTVESDIWRGIRDRGRAGGDPRLAWVEWSDLAAWQCAQANCSHLYGQAAGCGLDDESRWWRTNTALTSGRITVETLRADRRLLPPAQFATETLGWWVDRPESAEAGKLFPLWSSRADKGTIALPGARMALGIDTSWDRSATWIAVATELPDGRIRAELVATGPGTGWVRAWLLGASEGASRMTRLAPVAVAMQASGAPVSGLFEELSVHAPAADRPILRGLTVSDMARASGLLFDLVGRDGLTHVPHPALDAAADGAVAKPMSDAWVIDRKRSTADAAPLVALSVAVAALANGVPEPVYDPLASIF